MENSETGRDGAQAEQDPVYAAPATPESKGSSSINSPDLAALESGLAQTNPVQARSAHAHTPGPWFLYFHPEDPGYVAPGISADLPDDDFNVIHFAGIGDKPNGVHGRTADEAMANAQLIAAAPEMLAACLAGLEYDRAIQACGHHPEKWANFYATEGDILNKLYKDWQNRISAALTKAGW